MELRPYQKKVVDAIGCENAIVKMPTGSGKTFVAAEFVLRGLQSVRIIKGNETEDPTKADIQGRNGTAALFLVPTCDLASQQKRALKKWVGNYVVAEYFGRRAIPESSFDVLVSTPQAFLTLQQRKNQWFSWPNFFAVVFDEVHHVLKDHPYRIIAHSIKAWESKQNHRVQVLGLSASLTYAVGHREVEQALANLCHDLQVTKMISPSEVELRKSGYVPQDDNIETMKKPWDVPDGVIPENDRRPHMMHAQFMARIESKKTTVFAKKIYQVVKAIEHEIKLYEAQSDCKDELFKSPLREIKLAKWEDHAYRMKVRHCSGTMQSLLELLETYYVALRMVVQSWEEEEQVVLQWLIIRHGFHKEGWFSPKLVCLLNGVERLCTCSSVQSEKLESLAANLIEKRKRKGVSFRGIVFVQQRISAYVLSQYLNGHGTCRSHGLHAGYVAARNSRITPSIKVRPGDAAKCVADFRDGTINLIVATAVIEEGFDVPEANVVISYDYVKDTVELAQRFGRARQTTSSLTLMSERKDRPLSALKDVKMRQESIIKEFKPPKKVSLARQQSQIDRERAAFSVLGDMNRCERSPLEVLNMYASKTKAAINTSPIESGPDKVFCCKISYSSLFRTVDGTGEGTTKQQAKNQAAKNILDQLREMDMAKYQTK
ncbi:hypothetical protein ACHAWF_014400 [Thalassiosira exigua]